MMRTENNSGNAGQNESEKNNEESSQHGIVIIRGAFLSRIYCAGAQRSG
jgi:hypothetical protein